MALEMAVKLAQAGEQVVHVMPSTKQVNDHVRRVKVLAGEAAQEVGWSFKFPGGGRLWLEVADGMARRAGQDLTVVVDQLVREVGNVHRQDLAVLDRFLSTYEKQEEGGVERWRPRPRRRGRR